MPYREVPRSALGQRKETFPALTGEDRSRRGKEKRVSAVSVYSQSIIYCRAVRTIGEHTRHFRAGMYATLHEVIQSNL